MSSYSDFANATSAIIQQGGAQQAELQRQKGQIWGQTFQNLGQIAMNLPLQLQQAKTAQQEQQMTALKLDAMKRATEGQAKANQVIAALPRRDDGTYDTGALLQKLSAANVPLDEQEKLAKSVDGVNGVISSFNNSKRDHAADLAHAILSQQTPDQPLTADAVHLGIAAAKAAGLASDQDEAKLTELLAGGADPSKVLTTIRGLSEKYKDADKPMILPRGGTAIRPSTGQVIATGQPEPVTEAELLMKAGAGEPAAKAAIELQQAPSRATAALAQQREGREAAQGAERNRIADYRAHHPASAAAGAQQTGLSDEALNQAADKFFETGILPSSGMGGGAAADKRAIMNRSASRHPNATLAANSAEYKANSSSLSKIQVQRDAIVSFEKTANANLDRFLETAKGVVDSGSPMLNTPLRAAAKSAFGSTNQAAFEAARLVAQNEIAKVTNNPTLSGQLSDTARKEVEQAMSPNATLGQIYAVAKVLRADMGSRRTSLDEQIGEIKGRLGGGSQSSTAASGPKEGDVKPIPGFPGTEQTFKAGKWIRTK